MLQFLLTLTDESNHNKVEDLYNKYHDQMIKYAVSKFKFFGIENFLYDAEDAVQNTFVKIVKHLDSIDFSLSEKRIKNYCFSILVNEIYNLLGDKEEFFELNEEFFVGNEYNFIEALQMKELYNKVVNVIGSLDERYSTTLFLFFCQDMTVKEIAEMMGISQKTVYTRLERGKKLVLNYLKESNDDKSNQS